MPLEDRHGYPLGTTSDASAGSYAVGLDRFLALNGDAATPLVGAVGLDPEFMLGWATLAALHHFNGDRAAAKAALDQAHRTSAGATDRERGYLAVLTSAMSAEVSATLDLAESHLERFDRDVLAIEQVMLVSHFAGGGADERGRALGIFRHHERHMAGDWAYDGVSAFVHQEADLLSDAGRLSRRSLDRRPDNADAMHSLAHVSFERGAHVDGRQDLAEWVDRYDRGGPFRVHFAWHMALHDLGLGQWAQALDRYRQSISPAVAGPGVITDAPTLLWRLLLRGVDPSLLPWGEVLALAGPLAHTPSFRYGDWHVAFALAGAGSDELLADLESALMESSGDRPQAPAMVRVVRGLRAYAAGRFSQAADLLDLNVDEMPYLGGSRAQREVIEDTAIDAMLRCGRSDVARARLEARLGRRPSRHDDDLLARCS
jgi:hypothetical protein